MTIIYVTETERLKLCYLNERDVSFILHLLNDPSFIHNIGDRGVKTHEDALKYIAIANEKYASVGFWLYVVESKDFGQPMGICGLIKRPDLEDVDIGFAFLPRYWGKGYAREAAKACLELGRHKFSLPRIVGFCLPQNSPSIKVMESIGMKFEKNFIYGEKKEEVSLYGIDFGG